MEILHYVLLRRKGINRFIFQSLLRRCAMHQLWREHLSAISYTKPTVQTILDQFVDLV